MMVAVVVLRYDPRADGLTAHPHLVCREDLRVICAHCSTPVPDAAKFCHNCGSLVSDAEGQAEATASLTDAAIRKMEQMLREDTAAEYEIERKIGRGGMAIVYLAREKLLQRRVALKVLPPELTFGHGIERFLREAKTAANLDHPHIIPIHRISSGGSIFWYTMKYVEGQSLDAVLKERGRIPLDETVELLSQIASALDYAHQHHVVHRDMKPANVMLDAQGRVIVTDFGIAKALTEATLTASGAVVGTPFFMSPEQAMGKPVSGASDQYSVAVMAYRMLSGQVPFDGDSAIDILHKHCMMLPPPLEFIQTGLPENVYQAVHKGLEKRPEDRFSTVGALVQALKEATVEIEGYSVSITAAGAAVGSGADAATAYSPIPSGRTRTEMIGEVPRRRRWWIPIAAVVGVVLIALGVWIGGMVFGGARIEPQAGPAEQTPVAQPIVQPAVEPAADDRSSTVEEAARPADDQRGTQVEPQIERQPPPPTEGTVRVQGLPTGGVLVINGREYRGSATLAAGPYSAQLRAPGYETYTVPIRIVAGRDTTVGFRGTPVPPPPTYGTLSLRVEAGGRLTWAALSLNGELIGDKLRDTTLTVRADRQLRVQAARRGFLTTDTTVSVPPDGTRQVVIGLVRSP
jgi:tRNA A-37 threonylcarbamoyl transferase component Bud32